MRTSSAVARYGERRRRGRDSNSHALAGAGFQNRFLNQFGAPLQICLLYHLKVELSSMRFNHTVIAGTFDHLHSGHQKLLKTALQNSCQVSIGLTQPNLTSKKPLANLIEPTNKRSKTLEKTLESHSHYSLFPLTNPHKPADSSLEFDSIIASSQTKKTVQRINKLRLRNNLKPLKTHFINLVNSTDKKPISSTRIRKGQINRTGFAYHQIFPKNKKLTLPSIHRSAFQKPFSTLLTGSQNNLNWAGLKAKAVLQKKPPFMTIAVGDIAVISLLQQNLLINLSLVDLKTKRQPLFSSLDKLGLPKTPQHLVKNPPGTITPGLISALQQSLSDYHQKQTIQVNGEEDLSVLPAILLSPLNTAIFYGQPEKGLVYIRVTEAKKQKALDLLKKLT